MSKIFISYSSKDEGTARLINDALLAKGFDVFLSSQSLAKEAGEDFRDAIFKAFDETDLVIVLLSPDSIKSRWVNNEVTYAFSYDIPVCPLKIRECVLPGAWNFMLSTCQVVNYHTADEVPEMAVKALNRVASANPVKWQTRASQSQERQANRYDTTRFKAPERLSKQGTFFSPRNKAIYEKLLAGKQDALVLDVGCNNGANIMNDLGDNPAVKYILGIDASKPVVIQGLERYMGTKFNPRLMDIESETFEKDLRNVCAVLDIQGFDFINVSMVLLHLKNPYRALTILNSFLKDDGIILIRDIDDAQDVSYPDTEEGEESGRDIVKHMNEINYRLLHTGNRDTGRKIYHYLADADFENITSIPECLDVCGLDKKGREDLFDVSFSYIRENILDNLANPETKDQAEEDLKWFDDHIDDLKRMFKRPDYYFKLGTVIFSATKEK